MIWAVISLLAIGAIAVLVQPFFAARDEAPAIDDQDYLIAQLGDIARDRAAGLLSADEAAKAELEARRRLLAGARARRETASPGADPQGAQAFRMASVMLIAAAPIAAVAIYMAIGDPTLTSTPGARAASAQLAAAQNDAAGAPSVDASIRQLVARLEVDPEDIEGWIVLAESYASMDRFPEAADAFGRAAALAPERAFLHAALGEAIAMANGGVVGETALAAFDRALERDPEEPRARFYKALSLYQAGDGDAALGALVELANDAPPGAGWAEIVGRQIALVAGELERSLDDLGLSPVARAALGGAADAPAALEARIAAGGAPYTDWMALIEAYAASGDAEKTQDALRRARERYAAAPFVLKELDVLAARLDSGAADGRAARRGPTREQMQEAASMSDDERTTMIEGMVGGLAARLENEPDDLEGWVMLGRSYGVLGRSSESIAAFERAAALAPDDVAVRRAYAEARLDALDKQGAPIDAETEEALKAIARLKPDEPFALYFLGLAAQQQGDADAARDYWRKLLAQTPAGSEDAAGVQAMIDAL